MLWGRLQALLLTAAALQAQPYTSPPSSVHLHISWSWWGQVDSRTHKEPHPCIRWMYKEQKHRITVFHAHMPVWPGSSASCGGRTDDTLSLCSSFLFFHPSSIGGCTHLHMHVRIYTHTTLTHAQMHKLEPNQNQYPTVRKPLGLYIF